MSSSVHIDNKKDILILGKRPTQGLHNTTVTAEDKYPINFIESEKRLVLSLQYNGSSIYLFLMLQKYINSKQEISKIKPFPFSLGNV